MQTLFARLGVFVGGCTVEAAEAVTPLNVETFECFNVLDGLAALVNQSLLRQEVGADGEPRFTMLETIHEYALERLEESGEAEVMRQRHALYYLALTEAAEPELTQAEQERWLQRLEVEHDNLRVALVWCQTPAGDAEAGLRIVGAIWRFWKRHGYLSEGRNYLARILAHARAPTPARAKALSGAGVLAWAQGDYAAARALHAESLAIRRELGDKRGIATSLNNLGLVAHWQGDYVAARALHEESLAIARELGNKDGIANSLNNLGLVFLDQGDYVAAHTSLEESLTIRRELANRRDMAASLVGLAGVAVAQAQPEQAARLLVVTAALLETIGGHLDAANRAVYERSMAIVRAALSEDQFAIAWAAGRTMTLEQAIAEALNEGGEGTELPQQGQATNTTV